jgi:Xaa-Pro aminopeptidase
MNKLGSLLGDAFHRRIREKIQAELGAQQLDGLLLLDVHNVVYASGFRHIPSERPLGLFIPASGDSCLFVPLLEVENAADAWSGEMRVYFEYPGEEHPVVWMVRECGVTRLGIDTLTVDVYRQLSGDIVITPLVNEMRWIKEPEELDVTRQAARYADYCLEQIRDHAAEIVRGGGTELDILAQCLAATRDKMTAEVGELFRLSGGGVVGTVHSGERAALPHGSPLHRQPQPGEAIIAGIGASVKGYHAESGASFILGEPQGDQLRCLEAAAACDAAAIATLRTGSNCAQVNEAALSQLHRYGYADAIRHRIGHGMGLQGHESPWLAPGDLTRLVPNMVFSCEPGIYRPGIDGYRTINTMIVTNGAAEVPSRFLAEHPPEKRILSL